MKNQPKTIADLDINWTFTTEHRLFPYFEEEFKIKNSNLSNFSIKNENWIFEINLKDRMFKFEILIDGCSINKLSYFMFLIHENIAQIYDNHFWNEEKVLLKLIKFKETAFNNIFDIEVEEI